VFQGKFPIVNELGAGFWRKPFVLMNLEAKFLKTDTLYEAVRYREPGHDAAGLRKTHNS
jgi:hypothetical protein